MDTPVPQPRKIIPSKIPVLNKGYISSDMSSPAQEEMPSFVHVAEVHTSKTQLILSSDEISEKKVEKKRKKVRKRSTFILKKSEDDIKIYNSDEIDNSSKSSKDTVFSGSVKNLVSVKDKVNMFENKKDLFKEPLPKYDKKRGSATETLSDSSGSAKIKLAPMSGKHRKPHGSATETLSEDSDHSIKKSIQKPVPKPRSIQKSENIEDIPKMTESPKSYCTTSSMDYKDTGVIPPPRHKRHKKKRKFKDASSQGSKKSDTEETKITTPTHKDNTAVCLTIHGAEPLKMKDFNSKPFIRVHVIDVPSSTYKRSAFGKMNIEILQTHPFDCVYQRTVVPRWDEDLLWMEPISHIASLDTVLIFELISSNENIISWAFLRPVASNGATNVGQKLRLQFYKPSKLPSSAKNSDMPKAYFWWISGKYVNYKSTLFITLNAVPSNFIVKPEIKLIQEETKLKENKTEIIHEEELTNVVWTRLPSLSCKLPNKIMKHLPAGPDGGMAIAYSNSGLLLASHTSQNITIFTYKGNRYLTLIGHQGLVYSITWSLDDSYILSSSADATAILWDINNKKTRPFKVFQHPSYVYTACFLNYSIATGCYDYHIRIWSISDLYPVQNYLQHKARVNTISKHNDILASGDSEGVIIFWKIINEGIEIIKELKIRELKNKIINSLTFHSAGKRILVHTRDSMLRMIDIASGSIIQWFYGNLNTKLQTNSGFCGCGSRVLACSEDGCIYVWDGHTGEKIAVYKLFAKDSPAAVSFHPYDHMMAVISHSNQEFPSLTIGVYSHDGDDMNLCYEDKNETKSTYSLSSSITSIDSKSKSKVKKKKKESIFKFLSNKKDKKTETEMTNTSEDSQMDHRLTDIIKKMDKILVSVTPSQE